MSKKKEAFLFKKSWMDALNNWQDDVKLEVYEAIMTYAFTGVVPNLSSVAMMAFSFIKADIDANNAKYDEVVEKRKEAGKRGMASRYGKDDSPIQEESRTADNKSDEDVTNIANANKSNKSNKGYQELTNITDNDNDYDNNHNVIIKKETISNEIVKKEAELLPLPPPVEDAVLVDSDSLLDESVVITTPKKARVDYDRIVKMFNSICISLPKVTILSERRKEKVRQRFCEMGCDYSAIEDLFRKIQACSFLTGDNPRGWRADFDWVFKNGQNWISIKEGKYEKSDKTYTPPQKKSELQKNIELMENLGVKQENVVF